MVLKNATLLGPLEWPCASRRFEPMLGLVWNLPEDVQPDARNLPHGNAIPNGETGAPASLCLPGALYAQTCLYRIQNRCYSLYFW